MSAEIILTIELYSPVQKELAKSFTLHHLYQAADRDAFLAECAHRVRGLATFGKWGADKALIAGLPKLEIIANMGVGVDAIDLDEAKRRGIIVTNTPDVLNDCVAETAMSLVLNVMREFPQSEDFMRSGLWPARGMYPLTTSLGGKT